MIDLYELSTKIQEKLLPGHVFTTIPVKNIIWRLTIENVYHLTPNFLPHYSTISKDLYIEESLKAVLKPCGPIICL